MRVSVLQQIYVKTFRGTICITLLSIFPVTLACHSSHFHIFNNEFNLQFLSYCIALLVGTLKPDVFHSSRCAVLNCSDGKDAFLCL